jgi:type II secretory pathway pseudopilin PulG
MKSSGFTLLETIIYCALFSVLMSGAIVTVYALLSSSEKTGEQIQIVAEATFINQKLAWALSGATDVEMVNPFTLKIQRPDFPADNPLQFNFSDNQVSLARSSVSPRQLTGEQFVVSDVTIQLKDNNVQIYYKLNGTPFFFVGNKK